jgi:transposase
MMGRQTNDQGHLFYNFRLDEAVPDDHPVRKIDAVLDLSWVYAELAPHYPTLGRPSIDPVLMIRMLIIGYVFGLRSERLLCREVQVNFAYRWFCKLGIEHKIPDHSAFSRARNERFRESGIFRRVFERVVEACIAAGLVGSVGSHLFGLPRRPALRPPDQSTRLSIRAVGAVDPVPPQRPHRRSLRSPELHRRPEPEITKKNRRRRRRRPHHRPERVEPPKPKCAAPDSRPPPAKG